MFKNINIEYSYIFIYVDVLVGILTPDSVRKGINTLNDDFTMAQVTIDVPSHQLTADKTPQYTVYNNKIYLDTTTHRSQKTTQD